MAFTEWYFDTSNSGFVVSDDDPTPVPPPVFFAGDVRYLGIMLVRRTSVSAVEMLSTSGITLSVGIGTPAQTPVVMASGTSAAADVDGFFGITLDFSVTAVQTALGTSTEVVATMEIRLVGAGDPRRYALPCTIRQRILT
jgi:hypothetical protein